jgi:DNA-binding transcriptional regulator LsrR (DeoR family)
MSETALLYRVYILKDKGMSMDKETVRLVQVSKMYYEENKTQAEIAKLMGVSRPLISNLLSKAKDMGIVEISIKEPTVNNDILLNQLKNIYSLSGGLVIPSGTTKTVNETALVNQTASLLAGILGDVRALGLGWGYILDRIIKRYNEVDVKKTSGTVCPLIGTASIPNRAYHPNELITAFSMKSGFTPVYWHAPAFVSTESEKAQYVNTDNYREIKKAWGKLDTAILVVGGYPSVPDHATALRFGKELQQKKAVGKIISHFYNKDGEFIHGANDHTLQMPIEILSSIKRVYAIFPCDSMAACAIGALRTGVITHAIMTEDIAQEVIRIKSM